MATAFDELKTYPLVYLATPYTKYPHGLAHAFRDAAKVAARLMIAGIRVYSPIAHSHPLAIYGGILPTAHAIWLPFDEAMMDKSDALLVAKMETWEASKGIAHEIEHFQQRARPIYYIEPHSLLVSDAA